MTNFKHKITAKKSEGKMRNEKYDHVTPELHFQYPVSFTIEMLCMYGRAPEYLSTLFNKRCDVNRYTTRSSQLLNVPLFKTASGHRTFYYQTISIWNSLESILKLSSKTPEGFFRM